MGFKLRSSKTWARPTHMNNIMNCKLHMSQPSYPPMYIGLHRTFSLKCWQRCFRKLPLSVFFAGKNWKVRFRHSLVVTSFSEEKKILLRPQPDSDTTRPRNDWHVRWTWQQKVRLKCEWRQCFARIRAETQWQPKRTLFAFLQHTSSSPFFWRLLLQLVSFLVRFLQNFYVIFWKCVSLRNM
jgi:hypothetical protein